MNDDTKISSTESESATNHPFEVERLRPGEILETRLYQCRSLAFFMYGTGGEALRRYSSEVQDGVSWALATLLDDCYQSFHRDAELAAQERKLAVRS